MHKHWLTVLILFISCLPFSLKVSKMKVPKRADKCAHITWWEFVQQTFFVYRCSPFLVLCYTIQNRTKYINFFHFWFIQKIVMACQILHEEEKKYTVFTFKAKRNRLSYFTHITLHSHTLSTKRSFCEYE